MKLIALTRSLMSWSQTSWLNTSKVFSMLVEADRDSIKCLNEGVRRSLVLKQEVPEVGQSVVHLYRDHDGRVGDFPEMSRVQDSLIHLVKEISVKHL